MKKATLVLFCLWPFLFASAQTIPHLKNGQLIVDGQPHLMIAGELHNSSASSKEYMQSVWPKLKSLNLNTVLATITWDQFEQEEGSYDYELIDYLIEESEKNDLKLVVIWFASWKNGESSYIPMWVKEDTKRFPRAITQEGKVMETLSVFSDNSRNADAKAFTALMQRIKEKDENNTVIMVQPENEVGLFGAIDYRKEVLKKYEEDEVPKALMTYLNKNERDLKEEVSSVWKAAGSKKAGTWKEIFGDNPQSKEFFMAWHYAQYMDYVAASGRKVHDLPMFVNAWIVQKPEDLPGVYPNGGPVSRVMDIYKAAAPSIDIICPDIYLPNYKEIYAMYVREDNSLLVPESSLDAARAFYAFAEHDAICFSPFGIEDAAGDILYSQSYAVLGELHNTITKYQGKGAMKGIHLTKDYQDETFEINGYEVTLKIQDPNKPAFGLLINTGDNEFLASGMNFKAWFKKDQGNKMVYIGKVTEGRFENNEWVETRWLNGDETWHNSLFRALGREIETGSNFQFQETDLKVSDGEQFVYSPGSKGKVIVPGIYKIVLYDRQSQE